MNFYNLVYVIHEYDPLVVVFVAEIVWLITGVVWIVQNYSTCEAAAPKKALLGL